MRVSTASFLDEYTHPLFGRDRITDAYICLALHVYSHSPSRIFAHPFTSVRLALHVRSLDT